MERSEWTDARIWAVEAVPEQLTEQGPGDIAGAFARAFELAMRIERAGPTAFRITKDSDS